MSKVINKSTKPAKAKVIAKASKSSKAKVIAKSVKGDKADGKPVKKWGVGVQVNDTQRITIVSKANPKRNGSDSAKRFALYFSKKPRTVADAIKAGITRSDVKYDAGHGYIRLA